MFAAVAPGDTEKETDSLASKVLKMKLWDDESGGRVCLPLLSPCLPTRLLKCSLAVEEERARH